MDRRAKKDKTIAPKRLNEAVWQKDLDYKYNLFHSDTFFEVIEYFHTFINFSVSIPV